MDQAGDLALLRVVVDGADHLAFDRHLDWEALARGREQLDRSEPTGRRRQPWTRAISDAAQPPVGASRFRRRMEFSGTRPAPAG